jgi:PAS domain S-box-containing protein
MNVQKMNVQKILEIINAPPFGFAHHEIILDELGTPIDYRFLEVNSAYEQLMGLSAKDIIGKTVKEANLGIEKDNFDWITFFGKVALEGGNETFEQYSAPLNCWYQGTVYSSEKGFFTVSFVDITKQKKQTEELESFFTVNLDLLCIADTEGNFIKTNEAWSRILGYTTEDLNSRKFLEFIHPDDMQATFDALTNLDKGDEVLNFTNRYRCKDGTYKYIEWRSHPKGNLIYAAARDVTEKVQQKATDDEKLRQAGLLKSLLFSIPDIVFYKDVHGVYLGCNPLFVEMVGKKSEDEVVGKTDYDLFSQELADSFRHYDNEMLKDLAPHQNEEEVAFPDGRKVLLDTLKTPCRDQKGKLIGVLGICRDITVRKKIEDKIAKSNNRLKLAQEVGNVGSWEHDFTTNIVTWSDHTFKIYEAEQDNFEVEWENIISHYPTGEKEKVLTAFNKAIAEKKDLFVEHGIITCKGNSRFVAESGRLILAEDGEPLKLVGSVADITDRKNAEEKLLESEIRFSAAIEGTEAGIWDWDIVKDEVVFFKQWKAMLGYEDAEIENLFEGWKNLWHPDDVVAIEKSLTDHLSGLTEKYEIIHRCRHKDGSWHWIMTRGKLLRDIGGTPYRWIGTNIDITAQKQAEEDLIIAKKQAEAGSKAKSEFLANMSHEIRTPLNAVLGMGQLLADTKLNSQQRDYLKKINRSSKLLLGVVNDVLDISKIEAGKLELEHHPFMLQDMLNDIRMMFASIAQKKGLEFILNADVNLPRAFVGDSLRLGQVFTNLLSNALKFTETGHVGMHIRKSAEEPASEDTCLLTFSIEDSGIGIDEEQMGRLFKTFSQADSSTTRKYGGTGLGLVISSRLVEAMGGTLEVSSVRGEGSRFFFTIELPKASHQTGITDRPAVLSDGMNFLVVDDQDIARNVLRVILESWNVGVVEAASGMEAVEAVLAAQEQNTPFDFILMDLKMPGEMDGLEAIRHLKHLHEIGTLTGKETPIFVISAYNRDEIPPSESRLYKAFLGKPVIASELFYAMMQATGGKIGIVHETNSSLIPSFEGYTILLVEDNELNQEVATGFLYKTKAKVIVAENGKVALKCHEENRIDLVLMDLQMPVMSGYTATAEIRRLELESGASTHLPIIALSAAVMEDDRKQAAEAGVDGHLGKPIDSQELYTIMGEYLKKTGTISAEITSTEETAEEFPVLVGFDLEQGKASAQGKRENYKKLLRSLHTQLTGAFAGFPARISSLTFEEIQHEAHTIKGTAATVGAIRLATAAAAIDKTSTEQKVPTEAMIHELREALVSAKEQIVPYLTIERTTVAVDEVEGHQATNTLLEILCNNELADDAVIETVVKFVEAKAGSEKAGVLRRSIEQFELDVAVYFLEKFQKGAW